jgi:hypothetical protein
MGKITDKNPRGAGRKKVKDPVKLRVTITKSKLDDLLNFVKENNEFEK